MRRLHLMIVVALAGAAAAAAAQETGSDAARDPDRGIFFEVPVHLDGVGPDVTGFTVRCAACEGACAPAQETPPVDALSEDREWTPSLSREDVGDRLVAYVERYVSLPADREGGYARTLDYYAPVEPGRSPQDATHFHCVLQSLDCGGARRPSASGEHCAVYVDAPESRLLSAGPIGGDEDGFVPDDL